jgi:molybdopterin molybdotransferase
LITFDEATALTIDLARPIGVERTPLRLARGRVLAEPVLARASAPARDTSAMDGYALRDADLQALPASLLVAGEVFAGGAEPGRLPPGACMRIFTGAPLPLGADRVVIQEEVARDGANAVFEKAACEARHVRRAGSDFRTGDLLIASGVRLNAQRLVAAAAADLAEVEIYRTPRVAILATGDELAEPGEALAAGRIPDSVSPGVAALVEDWGGRVVWRRRCGDRLEALTRAARRAVEAADVVVVTGGASVGEKDYARAMFAPLGLEPVFTKVAIKPGKPVWLGRVGATFVVGLPGNPSAALVTARLFLAPLLAGLGGRDPAQALGWRRSPLAHALGACAGRETFHRGRLTDDGRVEILGMQDSAAQAALASADLLVRRRPGEGSAEAAEPVDCLPL